jgi:anti-sigma-K factor RskA
LESYALGLCNAQEMAEVERMCMLHPEIKAELEEISASLEGYAESHAATPAMQTRDRIFAEIDSISTGEDSGKTATRIIPLSRYLAAAAIVLFGLSLVGNLLLYNKWKQANEQVTALNNEKNVLADNLKTNQVKLGEMNNSMAVISDPEMTRVMMKGLPKSPGSMAVVYWNKQNKEVYLDVKSLPVPAEGKQYQLWAIVDGKPVDAGMLSLTDSSSVHRMKDFESAQAFAITLEKAGGSSSPTMDEMVVMGTTSI